MGSQAIAQRIEQWPIEKLIPHARNPKKNDHAVDRMAASINEFGFKVPVLARSSGDVIDGHLRLKAAQKLGITEVPVILCDDWTEAQVKAFRLLVNRSVTWVDWDPQLLSLEMLDLRNLDYDIDLTGFGTQEIDELLLAQSEDPHEDGLLTGPAVSLVDRHTLLTLVCQTMVEGRDEKENVSWAKARANSLRFLVNTVYPLQ